MTHSITFEPSLGLRGGAGSRSTGQAITHALRRASLLPPFMRAHLNAREAPAREAVIKRRHQPDTTENVAGDDAATGLYAFRAASISDEPGKADPPRLYHYQRIDVHFDTVVAMSEALGHKLVDQRVRAVAQNDSLGDEIADATRRPVEEIADGSWLSAPADMGIIDVPQRKGELASVWWEPNDSGHGGPFVLTNVAVQALKSTCTHIGESFAAKGRRDTVVMIACSLGAKPNQYVIDKFQYADWIAEPLREKLGRENVDVIWYQPGKTDKLFESEAWTDKPKVTILVGYIQHLAACPSLRREGDQEFLGGRRVDAIVNGRHVEVLNNRAKQQDPGAQRLNPRRTLLVNRTSEPGAGNKHLANLYWNEFNKTSGEAYPETNIDIPSFEAFNVEEAVGFVKQLHGKDGDELRRMAIGKPGGTGNGVGIKPFTDIDAKPKEVTRGMLDSYKEVRRKYNDAAGADIGGFPYTITEFFEGRPLSVPKDSEFHYADGMIPELRLSVMAEHKDGKSYLFAVPEIVKLRDPDSPVGNVHAQMERTGLPAEAFVLPLCREDVMEMLGISKPQMISMCDRLVQNTIFMLKNPNLFPGDATKVSRPPVQSTASRLGERVLRQFTGIASRAA